VPEDLQRLRSLGFFDFLIFKLMREAGEHGKRLSDVVEVTWEHLKRAKAPINYLRSLLRGTVDFGHLLRHRNEAKVRAEVQLKRKFEADQIARHSAGQTFVDVSGQRKYVIDAEGEGMVIYNRDEGIGRQAAAWKAGFADAITRGQIRLATPSDLDLFQPALSSYTKPNEERARPPVTAQIREHIAGLRSLLEAKHLMRTA
jgi:hypothetical protein